MNDTTENVSTETTPSKWTSRKLWVSVFFSLVFTLLLWYAKIDQSTFSTLIVMSIGGYLISNVSQKVLVK